MAYEIPGRKMSAIAAVSLANYQFHFVKITADNTVNVCSALTDIPCGILQNAPGADEAAEIMVSGISKLQAVAAGLAVAVFVGTDAAGHGIVVDPDGALEYYYCGQVVESAGANEFATVLFDCAAPVLTAKS